MTTIYAHWIELTAELLQRLFEDVRRSLWASSVDGQSGTVEKLLNTTTRKTGSSFGSLVIVVVEFVLSGSASKQMLATGVTVANHQRQAVVVFVKSVDVLR
ncbi:hypothetical protein T03_15304 [Trichinella britovi]|uniref:Uncharacterized protein n=1 Tax=Trichinella britovi TaxID=45882 RepID=A0A0V1CXF4_TRIBR|nr:hypothetical protein T03_15304 [Trichinella britovi]KRZ87175.1 hypothetical protein T08_11057 [Trichinella sp. T8]